MNGITIILDRIDGVKLAIHIKAGFRVKPI